MIDPFLWLLLFACVLASIGGMCLVRWLAVLIPRRQPS
jgi:hypothetical protein